MSLSIRSIIVKGRICHKQTKIAPHIPIFRLDASFREFTKTKPKSVTTMKVESDLGFFLNTKLRVDYAREKNRDANRWG